MKKYGHQVIGKDLDTVYWGTGVKDDAEADRNMSSGTSSGNGNSGNYSTQKQKIVVEAALSKQGKRYVWGATGPNTFDCSGLMMWAHRQAGINIPRVSADQGTGGKYIKKSDMLPGDICWYQGHVMMYIGGNKQVHAPQPGDVVRVVNMRWGGLKAIRRYWW